MSSVTRSEFMKCCVAGFCSCAVMAVEPTASAEEAPNPETEWLKSQTEAMRVRYAKLAAALDQELNEEQKTKVFENMGRECARQFRSITFDKYRGDIDGFLQSIQRLDGWVEQVEYNKQAGIIRIIDRAGKCTCPLVKAGMTPAVQCKCTLGWQKETYSAILGRNVDAELEESILRGGKRCVFRIITG
jgi:predicted hydrocarbon binding protein